MQRLPETRSSFASSEPWPRRPAQRRQGFEVGVEYNQAALLDLPRDGGVELFVVGFQVGSRLFVKQVQDAA